MRYIKFIRTMSRFILSWFGSVCMTGLEHIPSQKPYIFVFNHMSVFDSLLVICALPPMEMRIFVGADWGRVPILGYLVKRFGGVYVQKGAERNALRVALKSIKTGLSFGLAPEGTRSKTFALLQPMDGAAYLALKANIPILPVGIAGTDKWWWNLTHLRRSHFEVHFGPAFTLPTTGRRPKAKDLPAYSHLIMVHIAALLPDRYHGYYHDSPALAALQRGEDPWPYCVAAEAVPSPAAGNEVLGEKYAQDDQEFAASGKQHSD